MGRKFWAVGPTTRAVKAFLILLLAAVLAGQGGLPPPPYGPAGAESAPNREQQWMVPTPEADRGAHAVLFRPPGDGPFRLVVIAHATTQNVLRRAQMPQPEYRAPAAVLVGRGFVVLVPERLGHGATGGTYLEEQGGYDEADYARSGRATRRPDPAGAGFFAGAIVHPAGGGGRDRVFRRRLGCAGAGGPGPESDIRHHRLCAGPRRPCQ